MCTNESVFGVDYVVVKLNGSDLSQIPICKAVQTFLQTKETIVVELRRHQRRCTRQPAVSDVDDVSAGGNLNLEKLDIAKNSSASTDDVTLEYTTPANKRIPCDNELILTLQTHSLNLNGIKGSELAATNINSPNCGQLPKSRIPSLEIYKSKQTQTDERLCDAQDVVARELADRFTEQEHHLFEQCLEPELDIEEVILSRTAGSKEPLGLSICYSGVYSNSGGSSNNNNGACGLSNNSDDNETYTEVFISDIQAESLAARDGRLRRGDQILQINGKDIKTRQETEVLMSEQNNTVTLLVSRYLYGDEGSDGDDDDDEEEYYVANNLAYANGFLVNEYTNVVDTLDKALYIQAQQQQQQQHQQQQQQQQTETTITLTKAVNSHESKYTQDELPMQKANALHAKPTNINHVKEKAAATELLHQDNTMKLGSIVSLQTQTQANSRKDLPKGDLIKSLEKKYEYDETEHIYETIPEDSESEPVYCSPYQSSTYMTAVGSCSSTTATTAALELQQQKQRVAQWLGIKSAHAVSMHMITATPNAGSSSMQQQDNRHLTLLASTQQRNANKIGGTLRSAVTNTTSGSSSSGGGVGATAQAKFDTTSSAACLGGVNDELENSSSAYNTGGSNNSMPPPLALVLNKTVTLGLPNDTEGCQLAKLRTGTINHANTILNKSQRLQSPKELPTIISSKSNLQLFGRSIESNYRNKAPLDEQQLFSKTFYGTDTANAYQTIVQQEQKNVRNSSQQQQQRKFEQQQQPQPTSTQFNAPNLSQYHFVSSQEVASASMNPNASLPKIKVLGGTSDVQKNVDETPMVWKVKRRPDGTRYIVRRPARIRLPVSVRKNQIQVRNNDVTTTEEDTISEVKIGRYWTKEERKRHIERARERRNQQQPPQQQQQQP